MFLDVEIHESYSRKRENTSLPTRALLFENNALEI